MQLAHREAVLRRGETEVRRRRILNNRLRVLKTPHGGGRGAARRLRRPKRMDEEGITNACATDKDCLDIGMMWGCNKVQGVCYDDEPSVPDDDDEPEESDWQEDESDEDDSDEDDSDEDDSDNEARIKARIEAKEDEAVEALQDNQVAWEDAPKDLQSKYASALKEQEADQSEADKVYHDQYGWGTVIHGSRKKRIMPSHDDDESDVEYETVEVDFEGNRQEVPSDDLKDVHQVDTEGQYGRVRLRKKKSKVNKKLKGLLKERQKKLKKKKKKLKKKNKGRKGEGNVTQTFSDDFVGAFIGENNDDDAVDDDLRPGASVSREGKEFFVLETKEDEADEAEALLLPYNIKKSIDYVAPDSESRRFRKRIIDDDDEDDEVHTVKENAQSIPDMGKVTQRNDTYHVRWDNGQFGVVKRSPPDYMVGPITPIKPSKLNKQMTQMIQDIIQQSKIGLGFRDIKRDISTLLQTIRNQMVVPNVTHDSEFTTFMVDALLEKPREKLQKIREKFPKDLANVQNLKLENLSKSLSKLIVNTYMKLPPQQLVNVSLNLKWYKISGLQNNDIEDDTLFREHALPRQLFKVIKNHDRIKELFTTEMDKWMEEHEEKPNKQLPENTNEWVYKRETLNTENDFYAPGFINDDNKWEAGFTRRDAEKERWVAGGIKVKRSGRENFECLADDESDDDVRDSDSHDDLSGEESDEGDVAAKSDLDFIATEDET